MLKEFLIFIKIINKLLKIKTIISTMNYNDAFFRSISKKWNKDKILEVIFRLQKIAFKVEHKTQVIIFSISFRMLKS